MGRGRQKAKATKQARDMKYYSPSTDYSALERELRRSSGPASTSASSDPFDPDYADYSEYVDKYDALDSDDEVGSRRIG